MNKEFKNLLNSIMENPAEAAEKVNDANYKSILPKQVYEWHKRMKQDRSWADYVADVLTSEYQYEMINQEDVFDET